MDQFRSSRPTFPIHPSSVSEILFLFLFLFPVQPGAAGDGGSPADEDLPNIVLIISDDMAYHDVGFMGSEIVRTPNLDLLAESGTVFTHGYVPASVCLPTLNALLTGLFPYQLDRLESSTPGAEHVTPTLDPPELEKLPTLPRLLGEKGYVSFEGGKYWAGPYSEAGFTSGMTASREPDVVEEYGPLDAAAGGDGLALGRETMDPLYQFIDANSDTPFFVWYAPMLPHHPHDPPFRHLKYYRHEGLSMSAEKYYANITRLDETVGDLIDHLHEAGELDETVFVFLSDNGWDQPPRAEFTGHDIYAGIGGPRGKLSMHEMGFRTPVVFSGTGRIPGGVSNDGFISAIDLFPTLLAYGGYSAAEISERYDGPGRNLLPTIEGASTRTRSHVIGSMSSVRVTENRPPEGANPYANPEQAFYVTTPEWYYVWYQTRGEEALYDKEIDPAGEHDVASAHPDVTRSLRDRIEVWREEMIEYAREHRRR